MSQLNMSQHLDAIGRRVEAVKQSQVYETQADIDRERLYDFVKVSRSMDLLLGLMDTPEITGAELEAMNVSIPQEDR